jgi:hypothetical protein
VGWLQFFIKETGGEGRGERGERRVIDLSNYSMYRVYLEGAKWE